MRLVKDGPLDVTDDVAIFTNNLGERDFANFRQLSFAETVAGGVVLVPVAVTSLQLLKLNS